MSVFGFSVKIEPFTAADEARRIDIVHESSDSFISTTDDRRSRMRTRDNSTYMILLYSQNPSMTTAAAAAAASHTYRTVTLTRYTLNYATLPDDPQLCRGPRSGKKKLFPKPSSLVIKYYRCYFLSPSGAIFVSVRVMPVIIRHRIIITVHNNIIRCTRWSSECIGATINDRDFQRKQKKNII